MEGKDVRKPALERTFVTSLCKFRKGFKIKDYLKSREI